MTNTAPHHLGGFIRRRGDFLNLSDMFVLMDRPAGSHPNEWLARPDTENLLRQLHYELALTRPTLIAPDPASPAGARPALVQRIGTRRRIWAHWRLALAYAQFLSPQLHLWCHAVLGEHHPAVRPAAPPAPGDCYLAWQFGQLHRRFDRIERHAADLMLLIQAASEPAFRYRRDFTGRSQAILRAVTAAPPFAGDCPCCLSRTVLTPAQRPVLGAQFDHFFAPALNRPEHGWLVCRPCHDELTQGGYLVRFNRIGQFHCFQQAVLAFRQAERAATDRASP